MRRLRYILLSVSVLFAYSASSQEKYWQTGETLGEMFVRLVDTIPDGEKMALNDSIDFLIADYCHSDSAFYYNIPGQRYLGQITSPDSLVKIVCWNFVLGGAKGKYHCYILNRDSAGSVVNIIRLISPFRDEPVRGDTIYTSENWYGALYYDVRSVDMNGEKVWVVLGVDYGNPLATRKIIDVISFSGKRLTLGRKWFETPEGMMQRVIFEYSSTAIMTLRFRDNKSILFDHLVPFSTAGSGGRQMYAPDYSYDAYIYGTGTWKFMLNVDVRNRE